MSWFESRPASAPEAVFFPLPSVTHSTAFSKFSLVLVFVMGKGWTLVGKSRGLLGTGWSLGPSGVPVALRGLHPSAPSFTGQLSGERHKPEEVSMLLGFSDTGVA